LLGVVLFASNYRCQMTTILLPIPDRDFDPTEVAVSWQVLTGEGHSVVFATESGAQAAADDIMVTGRGLDSWSAVPVRPCRGRGPRAACERRRTQGLCTDAGIG
jgi:hypothetical protein